MTGLEKIIAEIHGEAEAEAKAVLDAARAEAGELLSAAKRQAVAEAARIAAGAAQEAADIERSRDSAKVLQRRQRTLSQKQALLAEALAAAQERLLALPEGEYFELLLRLAAKAAEPGEGLLYLNARDKARAPGDFAQKLAAVPPQGARLALADKTQPISGGFVLKYGDVEQNCSVEAIFSARADEFADLIRDTLFA